MTLVGPLPKGFELATVYTAGVCTKAALPEEARHLSALLGGDAAREARAEAGFEPVPAATATSLGRHDARAETSYRQINARPGSAP